MTSDPPFPSRGDLVSVTHDPLCLDAAVRALEHHAAAGDPAGGDPEAGALVTFSGIVRAGEGDRTIDRLDYEYYPRMAEKEMARLLDEARARWPVRRAALLHRVGPVAVGEPSVIVAVSAGHRAEAFEAARFLIDELKRRVPIWKSAPGTGGHEPA